MSFEIRLPAIITRAAAQAAEPTPEITITGTHVKTIPYDFSTRRPAEQVNVTASVPVELDTLTLNSGVALLKYNVRQAAQPQIDALVAQAHRDARG